MGGVADQVNVDTFEYTLNGRVMVFRNIERGQLIMLERYVDTLRAKATALMEQQDLDAIMAVDKKISNAIWATIESQFTTTEDLEWAQLQIMTGKLAEGDLIPLLSNGVTRTPAPDDDAEPAAVKRPGRKAPAKKAAKKAPARRAAP